MKVIRTSVVEQEAFFPCLWLFVYLHVAMFYVGCLIKATQEEPSSVFKIILKLHHVLVLC